MIVKNDIGDNNKIHLLTNNEDDNDNNNNNNDNNDNNDR